VSGTTRAGSAWVKLLERGYIELIDKAEEASTLIATYPSDLEKYEPARASPGLLTARFTPA